ncbi:hypothetical protein AC578_8073 [Pseudocercospora eumusae]|uniref:Alpha/beta hydrolase fold-3 domain-containing protein n=1 Tax=Pseudocercospora eumusae TaxID=321146 RepID=A0A139H7T8_9PEZI|nr:hypothetical protein AC578_8073 [Pseudocercospora eumusae]
MRDVQSPQHQESIEMEAGELPQRRASRRLSTFIPHLPHSYRDERPRQYNKVYNRPRWVLHLQAVFWRVLMNLGMWFHRLAPPRPPKPNFYRVINSTVSGRPGTFTLYFYVPSDYDTQKRLWTHRHEPYTSDDEQERTATDRNKNRMSISSLGDIVRRRSRSARRWGGYPVVINFHGGGFTLGSAYDDARWCGTVVNECNAIVVSVDYRLAPENPFPTAVEDGVDAVLWIHKHAEELGINTDKIILSGFSSGGNMAFTVPLRLYDQQTGFHRDEPPAAKSKSHLANVAEQEEPASRTASVDDRPASAWDTASSSSTKLLANGETILDPTKPPPPLPAHVQAPKAGANVHEQDLGPVPDVRIRGIVPWYPSLDYTRTREERRATCVRTDQELPALFTNLFDDSYLHPPKDVTLDSPYLSPGVAPTDLLRNALPDEIIMYTCEWDMLLEEGQEFHQRLISDDIGKNVVYTMVPEVPHGWDKAPNPWKPTPGVKEHYLKACKEIRRILGQRDSTMDRLREPRMSIVN